MSEKESAAVREKWLNIFRRRGGSGKFVRPVKDLPRHEHDALTSQVRTDLNELAVIGCFISRDSWFVLTTRRLILVEHGARQEVGVEAIVDVGVDLHKMQRNGQTLLSVDELQIDLGDGITYVINIEACLPLSGVWSILANIVEVNKSKMT